jgi:hypothetical protein
MAAYASIGPGAIGQPNGVGLPTDLRDYFLNFGDPGAGFWNFLSGGRSSSGLAGQRGGTYNLQGNDPLSRFSQGQFDRYQNMWQAQTADEPGLGFNTFLQRQHPEQEYGMLTPSQQGFFSNVVSPRARMVLR